MTREHLPAFLNQWSFAHNDAPPLYALNQPDALPTLLAAQWLYAPDFIEYRGGVFSVVQPVGLTDRYRAALDARFESFDGNIAKVEVVSNTLDVDGFFGACDLEPYWDDLDDFVITLGRTWKALLKVEFPERNFEAWVRYGSDDSGPQVSFYQPTPEFTPYGGHLL